MTMMSHSQLLPTLKPKLEEPTKTSVVRMIFIRRYPAYSSDASLETASGTSGSQHTSSDKLSALPSDFGSSPVGRSAASLRMKSGALGGSELPSTSEMRLPSPPVLRATQPIPHSVSDSAVERETPSRQRVSFDSDRGSSTSPRPSKYSSIVGCRIRIPVYVLRCIYPVILKRAESLKQEIIPHAKHFFNLQTIASYLLPVSRMGVPLLLFWLEHTKVYTGVYSTTRLINRDKAIHAKSLSRKRTASSHKRKAVHALARPHALPPPRALYHHPCAHS